MTSLEYDKEFAVLSATPQHLENNPDATKTDNLIHESGRLQLNTYQAFVRDFMNPLSDRRALMLLHMTGTGKTVSALATATEYIKQYRPNLETNSVSSIVVLGFTKGIFKNELLSHPEFSFVNMNDAKKLKNLELHMHESDEIEEKYIATRRHYMRRLVKREVRGIYQFYGYREFAMRIINMDDVKKMMKPSSSEIIDDKMVFDTDLVRKWIKDGSVRINIPFIKSLNKSLIICDEVHNLYKTDKLNSYGLAISITMDYFFSGHCDSADYGCIRALLLSATPLTSSALEIIPIITLLTGTAIPSAELFDTKNGIEYLIPAGISKIKQMISGSISYIMDDNPREYPSSSFAGESSKGINYLKFIRCPASPLQLKSIDYWLTRLVVIDDRGVNIIKDITLPETKESPHGVIFSKNIRGLENIKSNKAVRRLKDGILSSDIFALPTLATYSAKYAKLVRMCLDMKETEHGKIFIYHPYVQGSGTDMIIGIMNANGFLLDGDVPIKNSICMQCPLLFGNHKKADHKFVPVYFTFVTGMLSKTIISNRLAAFNNDMNVYGEKIKIIIGSRAMRESHTLKACRHIIICHEPSSVSELIQIIGRAVRKNVHSMLPEGMRSVKIHLLMTYLNNPKFKSPSINEEESYRLKVLQYGQISMIDKIMYDASVDYLINFRFKQRETPPLLGEPYPLDNAAYTKYKSVLTKAYADTRNGVALHGIHTARFNVFFLDGEARLVVMIIKRILLDYQPLLTIAQLRDYVRNPPFHIEYNTELISDEAIAMALQRIVFMPNQLRITMISNTQSLVDTLFDQTSTIIDHDNRDCRVVCIGAPLCDDSYLTIRSVASIIDNDNSIIDSYRRITPQLSDDLIDMRSISITLANSISINDILDDITHASNIEKAIDKLSLKSHIVLVEWAIKSAVAFAINNRPVNNLKIIKQIVDVYNNKRLIILIQDLRITRVYNRYRKYDTDTGGGWWSKNTKPSTATLPIGHFIDGNIRLFQPADSSWISLSSIGEGMEDKHPFGWFIYEERIAGTLDVVLKIRFENTPRTKGITMLFLQKTEIQQIADKLKVKIEYGEPKILSIDNIEEAAWQLQPKMLPNRIIYSLIDI